MTLEGMVIKPNKSQTADNRTFYFGTMSKQYKKAYNIYQPWAYLSKKKIYQPWAITRITIL